MKTAIIVAFVALLTAGMAWAHQNKGDFGPPTPDRIVEKVTERLDLNDVQKEKLQHFAEVMGKMRENRQGDRGQHRQELMGLLDASTLDRDKAVDLLDQRHREFQRHMNEMVNAFGDFSDSLDAEQRKELKEIVAQRMEHRRERRHQAQ